VCTLPGQDASGRPDGRTLLATAGVDGTARIWDPATSHPGELLPGQPSILYSMCALPALDRSGSPTGQVMLAAAGRDGTARIWDPATGRQIGGPLRGQTSTVYGVCALPGQDASGRPDGRTLLATAGIDGTVQIWDPAAGRQIGKPLRGHTGGIGGVCALPRQEPGGRILLATAGIDGTVQIWDPAAGRQIGKPLRGHTGRVWGACALPGQGARGRPDGRTLLATAGIDGMVRIWDPATGRQIGKPLRGHTGVVYAPCTLPGQDACGRPDGRTLLATAGIDGTARIWDPATGRQVGEPLRGHIDAVWCVCALPDQDVDGRPGKRTLLATSGHDGTARIWDPATGRQVGEPLRGHIGGVWVACALPGQDGRTLLATTGDDGTVRVWDPDTGQAIGEPLAASPDTVNGLARCGSSIADCLMVNGDGTVRAWAAATAALRDVPAPPHASALAMTAGTDHDGLLTGDTAGLVHLTDLATGVALRPPSRADAGAVLALCPLPGERIAVAGASGTITIVTPAKSRGAARAFRAHHGPVRDLCLIARPGRPPLLASAGNDATIRIWDTATWAPHHDPLTGHHGWIWSLTALPAAPGSAPRLASAGADGTIRIWDPLAGRQTRQPLRGHTDQVRAVTTATSTDGRALLISGSHDGTVRLWHPGTGAPVYTIPLGIPVHALLQQEPDQRSAERTGGGATITAGLRTGILALDLHSSLFPQAGAMLPAGSTLPSYWRVVAAPDCEAAAQGRKRWGTIGATSGTSSSTCSRCSDASSCWAANHLTKSTRRLRAGSWMRSTGSPLALLRTPSPTPTGTLRSLIRRPRRCGCPRHSLGHSRHSWTGSGSAWSCLPNSAAPSRRAPWAGRWPR
jgi:WD40 repeat protein